MAHPRGADSRVRGGDSGFRWWKARTEKLPGRFLAAIFFSLAIVKHKFRFELFLVIVSTRRLNILSKNRVIVHTLLSLTRKSP